MGCGAAASVGAAHGKKGKERRSERSAGDRSNAVEKSMGEMRGANRGLFVGFFLWITDRSVVSLLTTCGFAHCTESLALRPGT